MSTLPSLILHWKLHNFLWETISLLFWNVLIMGRVDIPFMQCRPTSHYTMIPKYPFFITTAWKCSEQTCTYWRNNSWQLCKQLLELLNNLSKLLQSHPPSPPPWVSTPWPPPPASSWLTPPTPGWVRRWQHLQLLLLHNLRPRSMPLLPTLPTTTHCNTQPAICSSSWSNPTQLSPAAWGQLSSPRPVTCISQCQLSQLSSPGPCPLLQLPVRSLVRLSSPTNWKPLPH